MRLDFLENVIIDDKGKLIKLHETHIEMQRTVYEWEKHNIKGLIRCPFGLGKSTQIAVALVVYEHTLNKHLISIINSSVPELSEEKCRAIRKIVKTNPHYKTWCGKYGIQPLEFSSDDNDAASQIFFKGNTAGRPSIEGVAVMGGGVGQRCHRMIYDDVVDQKSQESATHRAKVYRRMRNTWNSRLYNKERDIIRGVFTPWHKDDANMKFINSGQFAELMIRINDDETGFELFEYRPSEGGKKLHRKKTDIPLWTEHGFTTAELRREKAGDPIDYKRNYRMEEDAVDESNLVYKHYSDEYEDYEEVGEGSARMLVNTGGNVTTREYDPSGHTPALVCDFNVRLQGWTLMQKQGTFHVVCHEFPGQNMTTPAWAASVAEQLRKLGLTQVAIYGDATSLKKGRHGKSDYDYIKKALRAERIQFVMRVARSNPLEESRTNLVNDLLRTQDGQRTLLINENCNRTRTDFKQVTTNSAGKIDKRTDDELTHLSDGIGYYCCYEEGDRSGIAFRPALRG